MILRWKTAISLALVLASLIAGIALKPALADEPVKIDPERSEAVLREKLVGTWRIISASFGGKPSELHRTSITLKLITPTHMIWIGYQPEDRKIFRSAGGSWTIDNGRYKETMRYGLDAQFKNSSFGKDFSFDCTFSGDRWIQSATLPNGDEMIEIWERVKPDEDVFKRPDGK